MRLIELVLGIPSRRFMFMRARFIPVPIYQGLTRKVQSKLMADLFTTLQYTHDFISKAHCGRDFEQMTFRLLIDEMRLKLDFL